MDKGHEQGPAGGRRVGARTPNALGAFASPAYRTLWLGSNFIGLGTWAEMLVVGWLVLVWTDSVLLSAATFALRSAPAIIAAPIGGAVADRFPRNWLLPVAAFIKGAAVLLMALVAASWSSSPWPIFVLVAVGGVVNSFEMPARQGLITDVVPPETRMNAISLHSVGLRAVSAGGAFASGLIAEFVGIPEALLAAGASILIGGAIVLFVPGPSGAAGRVRTPLTSIFRDAAAGIMSMAQMPTVSTLLWMAIVVEIFGFAYLSVMPALARDELMVTESGLGTLRLAMGVGAVGGAVVLSLLGDFRRKGPLLLGATMGYGLGLFGLAVSPGLVTAIALVAVVGAMSSMFDSMQWTLLQVSVPDGMRGRVIGGWVFAIGFGWLGHIAMGVVGEAIGVRWAIGGAGAVVAVTSLVALALSPTLRRT